MKKKLWTRLIIAIAVIMIGVLCYFLLPISAGADAFTQDYCVGLTGPGYRNCTQSALTWENYMINHNNAQFKKFLKKMVKNSESTPASPSSPSNTPNTPDTVSYNLRVNKTGTGAGTVTDTTIPGEISCGDDCSGVYDSGAVVTLTETPTTGSTFGGWGGACSGTATTCAVTMSGDESVTATFDSVTPIVSYNLNVAIAGSETGTVTSVPAGISCDGSDAGCSATYNSGASVVLTAVADDAGFTSANWTGGCVGSGLTCTVSMTENKTATVTFSSGTPPNPTPTLITGCAGLTVYTAVNYGGTGTCLTVGNYLTNDLMAKGSADNSIVSFKLEPGYTTRVSRDNNYAGGSQLFVQSIPDLNAMGRMPVSNYTWKNNISSLKVTKLASTPTPPSSTLVTGCAGLTAYTAVNYGGTGTCLPVGNYLANDLIANGSADNSIVSLKLEPGYVTTVFRDNNYTGGSQLFVQSIPSLEALGNIQGLGSTASHSIFTWKNVISSLKVVKSSTTPVVSTSTLTTGCAGVTFYSSTNYTGTSVCLAVGDYSRTNLFANGIADNSITSFKLEPGYVVTVSRDDNYAGGSQLFTTNISNLATMGHMPNSEYTWENNISSLKVAKL
jgi:hypothetical protein